MLEIIKLALRYRTTVFDDEIETYIQACLNDLKAIDIEVDTQDDTITTACISYCKWQLNFQDKGETWEKIYRNQKTALVLDSRYRCTVNVG